jgi:N-acetylmuramoyl-L-alanine amidase
VRPSRSNCRSATAATVPPAASAASVARVARIPWGRRVPTAVVALVLTAAGAAGAGCQPHARQSAAGPSPAPRPPATPATTQLLPAVSILPPTGAGAARAVVTRTGVVVPVLATVPGGWRVRTPCYDTVTLTEGTPIGQPTVVLDPGHGGLERGAIAPSGLAEADVNLQVARDAQESLQAAGLTVVLTRTADYDVDLTTRAEIITSLAPKAFVSVHHNAAPDRASGGPGSETFYQMASPDSKRLAGLVYEEVTRALSQYHVAWMVYRDGGAQFRPGTNGDYYAMLRLPSQVVGALSEAAFISNPPEAALLARPDVQRVEGAAVARGIVRFLTTADPGSGFTAPQPRPDSPPPTGPPAPCRDPAL